ncbi:maleylpyruvate isomerase N-terminal domain-containing protein [Mycobacterium sp. 1245805.9]|uniref:maleylpyruvate isomerase N-terminal domain-containing protein n=1 Tax=Mycobacterium sp. 1245805.9 TaxID=1856862 RepID=UPI0007FC9733|nr:maleylpyruvate isomerase N-terminal domain-containing protein [Mycobacterium sp. 1245805.9]OBI90961.1 hypothetical protein A9X00_18215 [Mycobacterium sp. 1245805.9]
MQEATKAEILAALDDSGRRFVSIVRGLDADRAARPVPGLAWTAGETAAHVVTVLGRLLGDRRRAATNEGVAELNATCLSEYTDRGINDIADRLEANLRTVIDRVYPKVDFDRLYPFHGGSTISAGGGARWILCELLVHGYDIAAATGNEWVIPAAQASMAIRGPAESMNRLVEGQPSIRHRVYLGKDDTVEFVASSGSLPADDEPIDAEPGELLLGFFERIEVSDPRLARVLADLPPL